MSRAAADMIETWRTFARDRGYRFSAEAEGEPRLAGRHEGIAVEARSRRGLDGAGWITQVEATPRIALNGSVRVVRARGLDRLRPPAPVRGFVMRCSSDGVARVVLDERVVSTLRALGPRLVELAYTPKRVELSWQDLDHDTKTLEDAIACVAYLAVAVGQTPYR